MQGMALVQILLEARSSMVNGGVIALDLNGVPESYFRREGNLRALADLKSDSVIGAALEHVDILHMNEEELSLLTGCVIHGTEETELDDVFNIENAVKLFLHCRVAIVVITRGKKGSFISCNNVERFKRSSSLPACWADCTCNVGSVELPEDSKINGNGAGDAFTAGFLVSAMLRHTGMTVCSNHDFKSVALNAHQASKSVNLTKKQLTPYNLYMRENYISLKAQLHDDKKAIFSKCHEMWESESISVKKNYEKKAEEENKEYRNHFSDNFLSSEETKIVKSTSKGADSPFLGSPRNAFMTNRCLSIESAVQFASLIAAYHVDVSTREHFFVDINRIIDRAIFVPSRLEEI